MHSIFKKRESGLVAKYWINITDMCNFSCSYCFQRDHHGSTNMSIETLDKVLEEIEARCSKVGDGYLELVLFGGEPLLNPDAIRHAVDKTKNYKIPVRFFMTTNLTILTEEMIKILTENDFLLLISMDGDRDTYEINRIPKEQGVDYFALVMDNLGRLVSAGFEKFTFSNVITHNNLNHLMHNVDFLGKFNRPIAFNFHSHNNKTPFDEIELKKQVKSVFDWALANGKVGDIITLDQLLSDFKNMFICDIPGERDHCTHEGDAILAFDCQGDVHVCHYMFDMFKGIPGEKTIEDMVYKINHDPLYKSLSDEKIKQLFEKNFNSDRCKSCRYFYSCYIGFINEMSHSCLYNLYRANVGLGFEVSDPNLTFCMTRFANDCIFEYINTGEVLLDDLFKQ